MLNKTIKDGFGIQVAFAGHNFSLTIDPDSITPPGLEGGDPIDTSTQSNVKFRTKHPKSLIEVTNPRFRAFYDPAALSAIHAAINDNVAITFTYPNTGAGTLVVQGFLKTFNPSEFKEGEPPTAECEIEITNENSDGEETDPVYTP